MPNCKKCGAEIVWIKTPAGKNMPCDAEKTGIVLDDGTVTYGHVPHWATCPYADDFRRKEKA